MSISSPHTANLQSAVHQLFKLGQTESSTVQRSLQKVIEPNFEIVFAGAFSAGKSMLINALLGRKLLYSAEGHATGTECRVAYAEPDQEKVILTFLALDDIQKQAVILGKILEMQSPDSWNEAEIKQCIHSCQKIIQAEGGASKSERAKQAVALEALLSGFWENRDRIKPHQAAIYPMEQFNFSTLQEAASYARRGFNSAVLKRMEYFCHHELLKDGNVLIDTPGIDAPVKEDAERTYRKISDPDTSAVICVLKAAETGELTTEETELLETIRANPGIRDRVFYVFNRVDKAWYNSELGQRLDILTSTQFSQSQRLFRTSGLLGFYGSQILDTDASDRFGLESVFAEEKQDSHTEEKTPLFVTEFNNYCGSGRLIGTVFRPEIRGYERPNENYVRILSDYGVPIIMHLIEDSGVEVFRTSIQEYLSTEKRPQLLENLADDLQPLCGAVRKGLIERWQEIESQPTEISEIQAQELRQLNQDLIDVSHTLKTEIELALNEIIGSNTNNAFEEDFHKLQTQMVKRLDELLTRFSVAEVHRQAQASHKRNAVVPLLGILAEAFYYLANGLEEVLIDQAERIVKNFFRQQLQQLKKQDFYLSLYRMTGHDSGIEDTLNALTTKVSDAIRNEAVTECDRYIRERPAFYEENSVSIFQLRETLQQACLGYDYQSMVGAEPAIRQLLKLDFEAKVRETVMRTFRQTINQTLNLHFLSEIEPMTDSILQQYDHARIYLAKVIEKEAREKIFANQQIQASLQTQLDQFNQAIRIINEALKEMRRDQKQLPLITESNLRLIPSGTPERTEELASVDAKLLASHLL